MAAPSAQARRTLQDAFERFASTVTPDDKRLFHNTQLKDVQDEAIRVERLLRARRMQKNMARLDPFLRGMEHYSKVVEVLCNGTPFLPWIWAPVKLMLMITADSISAFEKLIEAYGKIGDMLPRLDRLGDALVGDHNFQKVLALVYSDIIEFHRRAYKFVRRKSWSIFFMTMWAGFESRFDGILKNLEYHSELADKEAAAADIAEAVRRSKADDENWEQQERDWAAAKLHRVLTWLETTDTLPADLLYRRLRGYLAGSCDWFTQHKATELWLGDSAKNPLLWLCGKPGAGKSMICSALVQHAETKGFHVFYYFCSFLGSRSDGPSCLLRSLISQVIEKHQDLAIYVHDVYFKSHPKPTRKALLKLLPELLQGLGSVRLIVDGIDEWASQDQEELLKDLSQMISTDRSSHICKIMISSRETMDVLRNIRKKDKSSMTISLSNANEGLAVTQSIANFVKVKLSDLPDHFAELDPDKSIMAHVEKTLLEKSHGMFLWVSLVLDSLDTVYTPEELRTVVDNLPSNISALYEQILARLCSAPGSQSHGGVPRILSWICFARRPLHKSELLQALSMSPHDIDPQIRSIPNASLLNQCKPLIEELPDSTIVPIHFSVKEYLLRNRTPQIVPAIDAAQDISSACAVVIVRGLGLIHLGSNPTDYLPLVVSGNYRLLPYAIEHWIEHCSQYASEGGSLGLDQPLQRHLARLHRNHKDCLHTLGQTVNQHPKPDKPNNSLVDKHLKVFANMPIYELMLDVLSLRQLASQLDGDESSDIDTYVNNTDRTLFSRLAHAYESAVVYLLTQQHVQGIALATLRAFYESYASTAFRCRFPHCERLSLGFPTAELRSEHETVHIQRLYCQIASCQYSRIGFGNRTALNAHTRKNHNQSKIPLIPAKVERKIDAETENIHHQQNLQDRATRPTQRGIAQEQQDLLFQNTPVELARRITVAQELLQMDPRFIKFKDDKTIPPNVLDSRIIQHITPDVKNWNDLKAWVREHPSLAHGVDERKLEVLQILQFQDDQDGWEDGGGESTFPSPEAIFWAERQMRAEPLEQVEASGEAKMDSSQNPRRPPSEDYTKGSPADAAPKTSPENALYSPLAKSNQGLDKREAHLAQEREQQLKKIVSVPGFQHYPRQSLPPNFLQQQQQQQKQPHETLSGRSETRRSPLPNARGDSQPGQSELNTHPVPPLGSHSSFKFRSQLTNSDQFPHMELVSPERSPSIPVLDFTTPSTHLGNRETAISPSHSPAESAAFTPMQEGRASDIELSRARLPSHTTRANDIWPKRDNESQSGHPKQTRTPYYYDDARDLSPEELAQQQGQAPPQTGREPYDLHIKSVPDDPSTNIGLQRQSPPVSTPTESRADTFYVSD